MNNPITIDQIIALNECIADYAVQSSVLTENDTCFEQFVRYDTPAYVTDRLRTIAKDLDMHIIIQPYTSYSERPNMLLITTWRKDYVPIVL